MASIEQRCREFLTQLPLSAKRSLTDSPLRALVDFTSNDYLNLADNSLVKEKFREAVEKHGFGSGGSRLLAGNGPGFSALERKIAACKGGEASLIFSSGYQANISVLSTVANPNLLGSQALIFFDKSNHASLYQGAVLAAAQIVPYPHLNLEVLEARLRRFAADPRPKIVVSETLFGMDGDVLDVGRIASICKRYSAFLYLDDSHATGIMGVDNYGLAHFCQLKGVECLIMGTFSKAMGGFGAYVATSAVMQDFLINRCPGFIYSTALPPAIIEVVDFVWGLIPSFRRQSERLIFEARKLANQLKASSWPVARCDANIILLELNHEEEVLNLSRYLLAKGIAVSAIRPPTVHEGKSKVRLSLTLKHTAAHLSSLLKGLEGFHQQCSQKV